MKKYYLWILAAVLVTAIGIYVLTEIDLSVLLKLSPLTVIFLTLLTILWTSVYVFGVSILLQGMGQKVSLKQLYMVITGGGTASFVGILKLGIPVRVFLYRSVLDIPISIATVSVVTETALWLSIMAVIIVIPVPSIWGASSWPVSLSVLTLVITVIIVFSNLHRVEAIIPKRIFQIPTRKVLDFITNFHQGIKSIPRTVLLKVVGILITNLLLEAFSLQLVLRNLGWSINLLDLLYINILAYLVGTLSMMPLGLGTRDVSLVFLLTQLGPTTDVATAAALTHRVIRIVIPLILGLISINILGIDRFRNARDNNAAPRELQSQDLPSSVKLPVEGKQ